MIASNLRKIAADLIAIANEMDEGHDIDADALDVQRHRLATQADMIREGLDL